MRLQALFYSTQAALVAIAVSPLLLLVKLSSPATPLAPLALGAAALYVAAALLACAPRARVAVPKAAAGALGVVVTGCDSGLGASTAARLAAEGYSVCAACLTDEGVRALSAVEGVTALRADVTSAASVEALRGAVEAWLSGGSRVLHALVNNAGVGASGPVDWTSMDTYRRTMDVNFFGHVAVTKALLPLLYARGVAARRAGSAPPRVVNITSIAGVLAAPGLSAYCASKFALEAFSDALRRESAPFGLRVAIIEPSFLRTPILLDIEGRARAAFAALPAPTRARWGAAYAESAARHSAAIEAAAEPLALGVDAIVAAVTHVVPRARYTAGTQGRFLLPFVAALPAWVADPLLARAGGRAVPAGAEL